MAFDVSVIDKELKAYEEERQKILKERGGRMFWNPPEGESTIDLLPENPVDIEGRYGSRKGFAIQVGGDEYIFAISPRSPLYPKLLQKLKETEGKKPVTVKIVRAGTGQQTRYSILE